MAVQPLSPATDRRLGEPLPHQLANQTRSHLSAHKALVIRGCPQITLCGISSRFQLLSPTERQVLHALLTRSPLSQSRRADPVRLACVRHAASVRPEPGSNSQKIVSKQPFSCLNHFLNNLLLAILLKNFRWLNFDFNIDLKQSLKLSKVFLSSSSRYSIYKVLCCSQSTCGTLRIVTQLFHFVKNFFQVF